MKVLSISTDRALFDDNSGVTGRNLGYASKMDEMHIVVFTLKKESFRSKKIGNLYIHPTNSISKWLYVLDGIGVCEKIIKDKQLRSSDTVLSVQDPFLTGLVGTRVSKKFSLPLQIQIHTNLFSHEFLKSFSNIVRRYIAGRVIPSGNSIRVVSSEIKDLLLARFDGLRAQVDVLPVFVDVLGIINQKVSRDIRAEFPQFNFIVFMASRLTHEKQIDIALQAHKKVLETFPSAGLVIAGSGPEEASIKKLAKKLNIEKNVILVGWQPDLIPYLKSANIFLLTSQYEGYGMVLVEAAACGCPIVTTNVGVAKSNLFINGVNSFVCAVGDVACISKSITELASDNSKREMFKHSMQDSISGIAISRDEYFIKYVDLLLNTKIND